MKLLLLFLFFRAIFAQDETQLFSDIEERLVRDLFKNYGKQFLPPHNNTHPTRVSLGLALIHINSLDPVEQVLKMEAWKDFRWNDSRLVWNPEDYSGIKEIRVDVSQVWRPDISLYNSADTTRDEFTDSSSTKRVVISNTGKVTWVPAISLSVSCDVTMTYYPFDTHTCVLKLGSWVFDGHHLDLEAKPDGFHDQSYENGEWKVLSRGVKRNVVVYACCPEPYIDLAFNLTLARSNPLYQGAILFPVSTCIMLAIVAFLISPFTYTRMHLNAFLLFLFTFSLFHVLQKFPSVGIRTPALVLVCVLFIILTSLSIVWNVIVRALAGRLKGSPAPACIQRLLSTRFTKFIGRSRHENSFQMNSVINKMNGEPEPEAIVTEDTKNVNNWQIFLLFLDRLAFIFYVIIVVVSLIVLTLLVVNMFILLTSMSIVWNVIVHVFADHLKSYPAPACIQRLLSTWPIEIMGQSRHKNSFQMKVERNEPNGDPEEEVIEAHGTKTVNTWEVFLIFLDRLAFFFLVITVVVSLIFITRQ